MLQKANRRAAAEKTVSKIEARAIAFVVAQTIGLSTGRSHTFSVRIVQYEIGMHMVARLALRREEGEGFQMSEMALFEERPVRRVFRDEEWWFVLTDIVSALTDSPAPSDYLKKLRRRDPSLAEAFKGGGQFVPPLRFPLKRRGERKSFSAGTSLEFSG